jgi:hypothetical protein
MTFNSIEIYQRYEKNTTYKLIQPDPTRFLLKSQIDPTRPTRT